ncbi:MAG: formate dehydrogenase subunit gamma [Hyphomonadaceae bacterium]
MAEPWNEAAAETVIAPFTALEGPLLPMLHGLQGAFGCIPPEATAFLAEKLNLSRAEVHGVVSFYHDFRRTPAGRTVVKLCRAEACQAMGGDGLSQALLRRLGVDWNQTTPDGAITVAPVYCLGLCAAAPAALIGDKPAARLDAKTLIEKVEALR